MQANKQQSSNLGLTTAQVEARQRDGQSNYVDSRSSRTVSAIIRGNLFTIFNGILITAMLAVIWVGDWRDAVFGFVLIFNLAIGVVGELRSKRALDNLAVLHEPTSMVWRDGVLQSVNNDDLVIGDVVQLKLGAQIPADGKAIQVAGLEVNEAPLTGESLPINKQKGDALLSGTAVVAGSGAMEVEVIGEEAWAQKITKEAKQFSKVYSEIQGGIDKVLTWIAWALPLLIILLMWSQLRIDGGDWRGAVVLTVAGVVGMIPQGLVLLTSMNFGLAAAALAKRGVLIQELPAVEVLARVDVLCLDKTGTLTTGQIKGREISFAEGVDKAAALAALSTLVADQANATANAVQELLKTQEMASMPSQAQKLMPFSSSRKWAALQDEENTWVFGAPEVVVNLDDPQNSWLEQAVTQASKKGQRTVVLAKSPNGLSGQQLPAGLQPALVVVLEEALRPDAKETLAYFDEQGVIVKVISGDAHQTVGAIAKELALTPENGSQLVIKDARTLPDIKSPQFAKKAAGVDVFGRVTPAQKQALVKVLQENGYTVAMTGDGVNDALALKAANLGIAMGDGAPATKAVSRMVLADSQFSVLPGVLLEGRRIMANMERVSALFLSKTTYAMLLILAVALLGLTYPFLPRHLTYIGTFTIGVPAFFLSIAPNSQKYRSGFLKRTLKIAVPAGLILGMAAISAYVMVGESTVPGHTAATLSLIIGAMALLLTLARPWKPWRVGLVFTMVLGAAMGLLIAPIRHFFALDWPSTHAWLVIILTGGLAATLIMLGSYRQTKQRNLK